MRDLLSHSLTTITPFSSPEKYPVIKVGNAERVIRFLARPPNSKGMITIETFPDLMDGNKPRQFSVKQSLPVVRWHKG